MSLNLTENNLKVKAVILASSLDFGRCPLASRIPAPLWPFAGKPALQKLLNNLSMQGIKHAVICSNGQSSILKDHINETKSMKVDFLHEPLPVGTAGCIRDAACDDKGSLLLIKQAQTPIPPNINKLIKIHKNANSKLTAVFIQENINGKTIRKTSEIYICAPDIIDFIPKKGHSDIKEGLIPALLREGKNVNTVTLYKNTGHFRNRQQYLHAIANYLYNKKLINADFPESKYDNFNNAWIAKNSTIKDNVKIFGPVIIMENAKISEKSIIFGPTVIGQNVSISKNSLIENSVLWDNTKVGQNCHVTNSVIDYNANILDNAVVDNKAVTSIQNNSLKAQFEKTRLSVIQINNKLSAAVNSLFDKLNNKFPNLDFSYRSNRQILWTLAIAVLSVIFLWSYWPQLQELWNIWLRNDEYSSGMLVPVLALYILWIKRHKIAQTDINPTICGIFGLILAQLLRYFGLFFMYASAERISIVLTVASLSLALLGFKIFKKILPVLIFLILMMPLPRSVHNAVMLPLQNIATASATFCLEMFGFNIIREGNIIHLENTTVAVAEACNGLRMVTAFLVIIGMVVILVNRSKFEKMLLIISSLPIAIFCNTLRLTITAIAFTFITRQTWEPVFHDFGGYAMMPVALALILFELWIFKKITTTPLNTKQKIVFKKNKH